MFLTLLAAVPILVLLGLVVGYVRLSRRVDELEQELARRGAAGGVVRPAIALATPPAAPAPAPPAPVPVARAVPREAARSAEEWVGGTWLQNAGSVLLLLGVFFLLLWGYRTGWFGPGVLVAAGVAAGGLFAWRGDRVARTLPAFGHALVGIGVGTGYLSLHVGHFVLRVFPPGVAFPLLALASFAGILAGLRYRVQTIALLGVVGAYVPWIAATLTGDRGATLTAPALLAYVAIVDLGVYVLAARAGWSGLALTALLLTTGTWITVLGREPWSLAVQVGLSLLYAALGLAPLRRILRTAGQPTALDLALLATAPFALVVASWPFLAASPRGTSAALLLALAAGQAAVATWIDRRRERRDVWSIVVLATVAYLAGAIERSLGTTLTPLAWSLEGVLLIAFGLWPRAAALRASGYVMTWLGVAWGLPWSLVSARVDGAFLGEASVRGLVVVAALLVAARLLVRHDAELAPGERDLMPPLVLAGAHLGLMLWLGNEAASFVDRQRALLGEPALREPAFAATVALLWVAQGAFAVFGELERAVTLRLPGYGLLFLAAVFLLVSLTGFGAWDRAIGGPLHGLAAATLATLLLAAGLVELLHRRRDRLSPADRRAPELGTVAVHGAALAWSAVEARSIAATLVGPGAVPIAAAGLGSAAWLAQAVVLFALGWWRGSSFLRWIGLATFGLTIAKFVLLDLARVDAFWRFATAIAVGVVLLVVSYVYQRARRHRAVAP